MAEIIFRLPSKAVTYGYVEVKGTPAEFGLTTLAEAEGLGLVYTNYVHAFLTGEQEALRILTQGPRETPAESRTEPQTDGLEEADELIKKELGATEIPWEGEVDTKPKPWETSTKPANAVANEDW